jgi:hypothetical protein
MKRWQIFGLLLSVVWVLVGGLLASRDETWIAAWKLYCFLTTDPTCVGATVFLVARWDAIAGIVFYPLVLSWFVAWGFVALRRRIRRSVRRLRRQGPFSDRRD